MRCANITTLLALAFCATTHATLVVYEPFDYADTTGNDTQDISTRNGGTGFGGAWKVGGNVNANPPSNGHFQINIPGLTFPNLPTAGGFAGRSLHTGNIAFANRPISSTAQSTLTANGTTIWFTMLLRGTANPDYDFNFSFADQPIAQPNSAQLAAAGNGFGLDIQKNVLKAVRWQNSISRTSSAGSLAVSGNTTYLIAGRIIWSETNNGHELSLFNITDPLETSPGTPFATIAANYDPSGIDTIGIRDRLNNWMSVDEIRFATSFAGAMAPMTPNNPAPAFGAIIPGGDLELTWSNLPPVTGSDVWVDVWFGTNPDSLEQVAVKQLNLESFPISAPGAGTFFWRVDSYLDGPTSPPLIGTLFEFSVIDSVGDGIPDSWKILHFGDANHPDAGASQDPDLDGRTNLQEFHDGTNPTNPDTDADGLLDGGNIVVTSSDPRYADFATAGIHFTDNGPDRTFYGEAHFGTDPLDIDTDNDGLLDGNNITVSSGDPRFTAWASQGIFFTEAGSQRTFLGEIAFGTDPLNWDTDRDGLSDGREIAIYGTDPLNPDSDGDGVGDWYELYASFTDPLNPHDKPAVPYPLPVQDGSPGVSDKPVKVYIMSGQSNMVGFGTVSGIEDKSLETMTRRRNRFPNLIDANGNFIARQDVYYRGVVTAIGNGPLAPGTGNPGQPPRAFFGPELGFGQIMGWHHDEPVLLLKSSQGNRSLGWDMLPPGGVRYPFGDQTYPAYGEAPESWLTASGSEGPGGWYAGKQYDDCFLNEADMGMRPWVSATAYPNNCQVMHHGVAYISRSDHTAGAASEPGVGENWDATWNVYNITNVVDVLDHFATQYPQWAAQGFEIAGFVWWQGDRDRYNMGHATRYEENLVRLITSLRSYYQDRYPGKVAADAPFVLATLGQTTFDSTHTAEKTILEAKFAVDGDAGKYPQFVGNVKTVYAHPLSEGGGSSSHYNERAGTYMLVGDALGRAMLELLDDDGVTPPPTTGGFHQWIGSFPALTNPDPTLDFDGGGLATALEWVLGGNPTDASDDATILPTIDATNDPDGKLRFTFRRTVEAAGDENTTIIVEYGSDLAGWTAASQEGFGPEDITITEQVNGFAQGMDRVTVALPASLTATGKLFVRLNVEVTP